MSLDAPSRDQVPAITTPQAERAVYQNERQAELESLRRERATLDQETCQSLWPNVPRHAADYLRQECPEHFALAMDEAAALDEAELADPDIAPFLLDDCIQAAQIAALDAGLEQDSSEIAALDGQIGQQAETIALEQAGLAQDNTTTEVLSNEVEGLARLRDIAQEESEKGGGVDALLQRVTARLSEIPDGPERQAAQEQLASVRAMLGQMRSVVTNPQERQAFESILSVANLNLGASSNLGVFSDVMTRVDASSEISEETKTSLRASLGTPEVNTGSQAQDILRETRTDENGNEVPVWPEDNALQVRDGVEMYSDANHRQYLKADFNGHITTIDTTGWRGEVVGKYLEAMSFVHDVESFGGTGLFQSIYRIDFNLTGEEGFDAQKIDQILNIMGKWFGGFENADGDIRQNGDRQGYIRYMVRLLNKSGTATGFEESQADTDEVMTELGLRNSDGSPNWEQIDRLGEFGRMTYLSGDADYEDLKAYLLGETVSE